MKAYKATYSMGDIVTGGFFESIVIVHSEDDVKRVLNETHDEEVSNLLVVESDFDTSGRAYEEVVTTAFA